jgi:hypothetical protein
MQGINAKIRKKPKRVIFAEGEDKNMLKAAIEFGKNKLGIPILIGAEKRIRDQLKDKLKAKVHYNKPLSENIMYKNIYHRKDSMYNSKTVSDTILTLPIDSFMTDAEISKVVNIILIVLDHEETKFLNNMKKLIGDDYIDESLISETTEPIYEYIIEKCFQTPGYAEEVTFKDHRKLKIAFNKFYEKLTRITK